MFRPVGVVVCGLLGLGTCGSDTQPAAQGAAQPSTESTGACAPAVDEAEAYGQVTGTRSERSSVAEVAAWRATRNGPDGPNADAEPVENPDEPVTVCVFTGDLRAAIGPPTDDPAIGDERGRIYDTITFLVDDSGTATLDSIGRSGTQFPSGNRSRYRTSG